MQLSGGGLSAPFTTFNVRVQTVGVALYDVGFSSITAACTAAAAVYGGTLHVTRVWTGLTTQTIPCSLIFEGAGKLTPASGQTVTYTVNNAPYSAACSTASGGTCHANVLVGASGNKTMTGWANASLGDGALQSITTALHDTATGHNALHAEQSGGTNTADGSSACESITTASANTCTGYAALNGLIDGTRNVADGANSQLNNVHGSQNTSSGVGSLGFYNGDAATAMGYEALTSLCADGYVNPMPGPCNTAARNSAFGWECLSQILNTQDNSCFGYAALENPTQGTKNSGFGSFALSMAQGGTCGFICLMGDNNTGTGAYSMSSYLMTGSRNTADGADSLLNITTAINTVAVGFNTGPTLTTGPDNTLLGTATDVDNAAASHRTVVGYAAVGKVDQAVTLGLPTDSLIFGTPNNSYDSGLENGQCTFKLTTNTNFQVRCKGSDGTVRFSNITLAP